MKGISVCNVPVGSKEYVIEYLSQRGSRVRRGYEKVAAQLDPGKWSHPEIPVRQMLWVLVLACFQFQGDYWLRHVRPDWTETFAQSIDEGVLNLVQLSVGSNMSNWSRFAFERMALPVRCKGMGLRGAADRRFAQFVGAATQSLPALVD